MHSRMHPLTGENEQPRSQVNRFLLTGELDTISREVLKGGVRLHSNSHRSFATFRTFDVPAEGSLSSKRKPGFLRRSPIGALEVVATYGFQ